MDQNGYNKYKNRNSIVSWHLTKEVHESEIADPGETFQIGVLMTHFILFLPLPNAIFLEITIFCQLFILFLTDEIYQ